MSRFSGGGFLAFSEYDGFAVIEGQKQKIVADINDQSDNYILNVNKTEYIAHLKDAYTLSPLEIHSDQLSVSTEERMIPAEMHPRSFYVHDGKSYPKDVYRFHLPFSGQADLLKVRASTYSMSAPRIAVKGQEITFELINFSMDAQSMKREADSTVSQLVSQNSYLTRDLTAFNNTIEQIASQAFDARKSQLLKKSDLLSALGVPIRKSASTPATFAVPAKRTPAIQTKPKPTVSEKGYKPEPALDESIYQQILKITHDVGKQFERLPSTYVGKDEEHLRDHFLLILEPNFEGSATGETFNKKGKTQARVKARVRSCVAAGCSGLVSIAITIIYPTLRKSEIWQLTMARPLRIEFLGGLYHVTSRGDRREEIYLDDADRTHWLTLFGHVCK